MKSRRRKGGVDIKRDAFNNSNRLHPTPDTTVLPPHQDNPLHHSRRAFHLIHDPLRRLPHHLHPLLPLHPLPLAQDLIARLVAMATHLPRPLIAKMVLYMLCVSNASMMTKIALSQYNAPNSLIVQDSFVHSLPHFRLELPLCFFYLPFLLSHRTRDGTTPLTRSSVLVYNHPSWSRPGERSVKEPIGAIDTLPFSIMCRRHLKLSSPSLRFPSRAPGLSGAWPHLLSNLPLLLCLAPLLSLRDYEPASDVKNYYSNSHSRVTSCATVRLGALQQARWISEGCGSVPSRLHTNNYNHICTLFPAGFRRAL